MMRSLVSAVLATLLLVPTLSHASGRRALTIPGTKAAIAKKLNASYGKAQWGIDLGQMNGRTRSFQAQGGQRFITGKANVSTAKNAPKGASRVRITNSPADEVGL